MPARGRGRAGGRGAAGRGASAPPSLSNPRRSGRHQSAAAVAAVQPLVNAAAPASSERPVNAAAPASASQEPQQDPPSLPADAAAVADADSEAKQDEKTDVYMGDNAADIDAQEADDDVVMVDADSRGAQLLKRSTDNTSASQAAKRPRNALELFQSNLADVTDQAAQFRAQISELIAQSKIQSELLRDQTTRIGEMRAQNKQQGKQLQQYAAAVKSASSPASAVVNPGPATVNNDEAKGPSATDPTSATPSISPLTVNSASLSAPSPQDRSFASSARMHLIAELGCTGEEYRSVTKRLKGLEWAPSTDKNKELAVNFLQHYDEITKFESPGTKLAAIGTVLIGDAAQWYHLLTHSYSESVEGEKPVKKPAALLSWDAFKAAMIAQFDVKVSYSVAESQLKATKKSANDSYMSHLLQFERVHRSLPEDALSHFAVIDIYLGTLDAAVSRQVKLSYQRELNNIKSGRNGNTPALVDVSRWAQDCEHALQDVAQTRFTAMASSPASFSNSVGQNNYYRGRNARPNFNHAAPRYVQTMPTNYASPAGPRSGPGNVGVGPGGVPNRSAARPTFAEQPQSAQRSQDRRTCFNCHQPGHIRANCPHPIRQARPQQP
jgi:hypothetical protein